MFREAPKYIDKIIYKKATKEKKSDDYTITFHKQFRPRDIDRELIQQLFKNCIVPVVYMYKYGRCLFEI